METVVERLKPGDIFKVDFGPWNVPVSHRQIQEYRLIYVNFNRAYVEPLRKRKVDVLDDEEKKSGRTNIAPGTICTKISKDPLEDDDMQVEFLGLLRPITHTTKDPLEDDDEEDWTVQVVQSANWKKVFNEPTKFKDPLEDEETIVMKDVLEDDSIFDVLDGSPITTKKKTRVKRQRNADGSRHKEPGIQTRAIKDGTIRAKLFAAMKTTKSMEKLAAKMGMKKTLLLSHINEFWRAHGFGYTLQGDKVELIAPKKVAIKK